MSGEKRFVRFARWFNASFPWNQLKLSLAKRAAKRLDTTSGLKLCEGIQGHLKMRLNLAHSFERSIYLNASNIALLQLYRRLLRPGDVYVDAGANLGQLALPAAAMVSPGGKVYAFEPNPEVLERLRENVELNGATNVEVVGKGCWSEASTKRLYLFDDKENIGLPSLYERDNRATEGHVDIETVRIDDVVQGPAKLIKLDVEGAEWEALKGAPEVAFGSSPAHLVVELNPVSAGGTGARSVDLLQWLMEKSPDARFHVVFNKRIQRMKSDALLKLVETETERATNVWVQPPRSKRK